MSTNTSNYNLVKQDEAEFYDVKVVNQNLDKIDTAIKQAKDSAASSKTEVVDNLNSTATDKALSAKQGKVVNDNFIQLSSDFNEWHDYDYVPTKSRLTQHLEQTDGLVKHKANQISFTPPSGMTATTAQEALVELFLVGNSRKQDVVDKLLLVDSSLPITHESTWSQILTAITMISTGKKWASGTQSLSITATTPLAFTIQTNLEFVPSVIIAQFDSNIQLNGMAGNYLNISYLLTLYNSTNNLPITIQPASGVTFRSEIGNVTKDNFVLTLSENLSPSFTDKSININWFAFE